MQDLEARVHTSSQPMLSLHATGLFVSLAAQTFTVSCVKSVLGRYDRKWVPCHYTCAP